MALSFLDKKIFVVADSNLTCPSYLEYLRAAFVQENKKVYIYNNGIPGARLNMVMNSIDEELAAEKPDYALLSFGANDLGIWLYDSALEVTDEVLAEREARNQSYLNALETVVDYLRLKGIEPILATPMCLDENLIEAKDITTDKDNKEKAKIGNTFFKCKTFQNINDGLQVLRDKGMALAEKKGVTVWDIFTQTRAMVDHSCFYSDGVHYNEKGHRIMAELFYRHMFGDTLKDYPIPQTVKELTDLEAEKRAYFFVKYNLIFLSEGRKEGEELFKAVQNFLDTKGFVEGMTKERAEGFFRFVKAPLDNQKVIVEKVNGLYKK